MMYASPTLFWPELVQKCWFSIGFISFSAISKSDRNPTEIRSVRKLGFIKVLQRFLKMYASPTLFSAEDLQKCWFSIGFMSFAAISKLDIRMSNFDVSESLVLVRFCNVFEDVCIAHLVLSWARPEMLISIGFIRFFAISNLFRISKSQKACVL